jgi:hypothetical protein
MARGDLADWVELLCVVCLVALMLAGVVVWVVYAT